MHEKIIKIIKNPSIVLNHILMLGWSKCIPDDVYLKMKFRILIKKNLTLKAHKLLMRNYSG